jgi:hypothetical protein
MTEERRGSTRDGYSRQDGYSREPLSEGYVRKGGTNPQQSQVRSRPPAPAPLRPASSPNQPAAPSDNGRSTRSRG